MDILNNIFQCMYRYVLIFRCIHVQVGTFMGLHWQADKLDEMLVLFKENAPPGALKYNSRFGDTKI
jgi:hypothetical protein